VAYAFRIAINIGLVHGKTMAIARSQKDGFDWWMIRAVVLRWLKHQGPKKDEGGRGSAKEAVRER